MIMLAINLFLNVVETGGIATQSMQNGVHRIFKNTDIPTFEKSNKYHIE